MGREAESRDALRQLVRRRAPLGRGGAQHRRKERPPLARRAWDGELAVYSPAVPGEVVKLPPFGEFTASTRGMLHRTFTCKTTSNEVDSKAWRRRLMVK